MKKILLASGSEGRKELFSQHFEEFSVIISGCEEKDLEHLPSKEMVQALAERKASFVAKDHWNDFVCAFDTMVECQQQTLGKPNNIEEARTMLSFLSGKEQIVWTGYAISYQGKIHSGVDHSVLILEISPEAIEDYILTHPVTKFAGAYAIQKKDTNILIRFGSIDTIIGAPIRLVKKIINELQ
ncbi:MAG: Maf family protein [Brevinema sp.]